MIFFQLESFKDQTRIILDQAFQNESTKNKIETGDFYYENYSFCMKLGVKVDEQIFEVYMYKLNEILNFSCTTRAFYGDYNEII